MKYAYGFIPKYNTFFLDQFSGEIVQIDLDRNASTAEKVKNSIYGIHTESIFQISGKIIVFLAVLMAAGLPVTGFIMWRKKTKKS